MGSLTSRVRRTLPTKLRTSANQGQPARASPLASEVKDHNIERDGKDPQLLANLSRIGQVDVHSVGGMTHMTTGNPALELHRARTLAEQQAASARPVPNRLSAAALSLLLDERKHVGAASGVDVARLAQRYALDVALLERLARVVNSPSVGEGTVVRAVSEDGQEKITMKAVWMEPTSLHGRPEQKTH